MLIEAGVKISMDGKGGWRDNGFVGCLRKSVDPRAHGLVRGARLRSDRSVFV
jgi:hypothetical protein